MRLKWSADQAITQAAGILQCRPRNAAGGVQVLRRSGQSEAGPMIKLGSAHAARASSLGC